MAAGERRVLVIDDEHALADAIRLAIELEDGLTCVGVAGDVDSGVAICRAEPVDVVLMDLGLPGHDGLEGTRQIKACSPGTSVYIFTGMGDAAALSAAAAAGAAGFFPKRAALRDVLAALRQPLDGPMVVDPGALTELLPAAPARRVPPPPLTGREWEVLELLCAGHAPQAIARNLDLSLHTARGHVKSILSKVGAHSQLEAVVLAVSHGWVAPTSASMPGAPDGPH